MPFMTELFSNVGRNVSYPARLFTCNIWLLKPLIKGVMKKIPAAACMVRTTTGVTMAQGSPAANVLPQKSKIMVNFRPMPGTSVADVGTHIKKVVKNKNIEIRLDKGKEASPFSPTDSRAYNTIKDISERDIPGCIVAPYLVMGGTDACFYEPICKNVYRFAPFHITPELLLCTHATNERIPIDTVRDGVLFFKRYVRTMAQK